MSFPIEVNPFQLNVSFNDNIKAITLSSNIDWFDTPVDALTGEQVLLPLNARTDVDPLKVFATGSSAGAPSMISLLPAHIPNLEIAQVSGLQSALNSLVKSFASGNSYLNVSNNGVGDYTITAQVGTSSGKLAAADDSRFPASVTGLRKSSGVGSTDIAAVAKTDYWDTTVFVASGASHAKGLVPDPGASAGTTRFLCENATWVAPAGTGTVTSIATTSPISGGTITTTGTISLLTNVDLALAAAQSVTLTNASTTTQDPVLTLKHNSSGTAGTGFGSGLAFTLEDSTTNDQDAGGIYAAWSTATHASHASYLDFRASTGGAASASKARIWGSGGLSVNNTTDPGAGIVSATGFKASSITSSLVKTDGSGNFVAATPNTDYWSPTVFVGVGTSHAIGLVPDPGAGSPTGRFLFEDGTWKIFTPATASIATTMLATQAANTLLANSTNSTASPTAVTAMVARSSSLLNLESIKKFNDSNYSANANDKYITTNTTFTAARTVQLPLAASFNPGQTITIADDAGAINGANVLNITKQGSDTIQGSSSGLVLDVPKGSYTLSSDGVSKWSVNRRSPSIKRTIIIASGTYTTPTGAKCLFVEGVGGGGGGGGALGAASQASAGSGGGGAGYGYVFIPSPATSYSVTIGAAGTGGVGANPGNTGGATQFGSALNISGGSGGDTMPTGTSQLFLAGGTGNYISAGDWGAAGGDGFYSVRLSGTVARSGDGAPSPMWSGNTHGRDSQGDGTGGSGTRHFGGGGPGAVSFNTTPQTGGDGCQGVIIVTEFY